MTEIQSVLSTTTQTILLAIIGGIGFLIKSELHDIKNRITRLENIFINKEIVP